MRLGDVEGVYHRIEDATSSPEYPPSVPLCVVLQLAVGGAQPSAGAIELGAAV